MIEINYSLEHVKYPLQKESEFEKEYIKQYVENFNKQVQEVEDMIWDVTF